MSRETLTALAERCEQATGQDRRLDVEIVAAITPRVERIELGPLDVSEDEYLFVFYPPRTRSESWLLVPRYTSSLDAARGLSDWVLTYASDIGADGMAMVELSDPRPTPARTVQGIAYGGGYNAVVRACCAAALRARAATEPGT